ncbi:hypothetical protein [Oscillatoria acuminata]|uniref:Flagellar assembly protein H n=1 Tax=Oscillatoria acuminata PCC 6304 TaxID=56110 RepID=K9TC33_9CYAN|nr:hypothetical protein [Oscillatoria acuminata]AFY79978.1 hypothetical protein Oscil6304_0225 [Oscillatoria acuminata PCC 6304]
MTRFVYDQFAKQYLTELLSPFGEVEASRAIAAEVREVDVIFSPASDHPPEVAILGLLGRLATTAAIFEPFRNAIQPGDIRSCLSKLFELYNEFDRQANRENTRLNEAQLPHLWILSPTVSQAVLSGFKAELDLENWGEGVYFLGRSFKTGIVVIHQLPKTPETLWLRMLGKGNVQKQAIAELRQLPEDNPFRVQTLELLYNLLTILEVRQDLETEDQSLIMELSPLYLERLENANQRGIQQGIQQGFEQGQRRIVEGMLQAKFGEVDAELSAIIESLLLIPPVEISRLIAQLSREELLARVRNTN